MNKVKNQTTTLSLPQALAMYKKEPGNHELARALGVAAFHAGEYEQAVEYFEAVTKAGMSDFRSRKHLAVSLVNTSRLPEAHESLLSLHGENPNDKDVLNALVNVSALMKDSDAAYRYAMEYIQKFPTDYLSYLSLGNILFENKMFKEAIIAYETANDLGANVAAVDQNIASCLFFLGQDQEALEKYRVARVKHPNSDHVKFLMAYPLLESDQFEEGWKMYEYGFLPGKQGRAPLRIFENAPRWKGAKLNPSQHLLVWGEQGLGDQIMFGSCLPDLRADQTCSITLEIAPRLVGLYARSFPGITVRAPGGLIKDGKIYNDERYDGHIPIGSLPSIYRPDYSSFKKSKAQYLRADPKLVQGYSNRFLKGSDLLKVGLCWRSGLVTSLRAMHYSTLSMMRSLLDVSGIVFVNLQYGDCADEIMKVQNQTEIAINNWPDVDLKNDQESVAAIISNLDLVISAPTAVAQLAGALGVETWVFSAGKTWTDFGRKSSRDAWHPHTKKYRQNDGEDLGKLFERMALDLQAKQKDRAVSGAASQSVP
ncbi:MAG: tetratricopeptide repeat protein [Proteobacteria bacterium]|nr:tetratricopeptide repeat protein [Pseudomonadota bacterium]